jgi:hypothetical protein
VRLPGGGTAKGYTAGYKFRNLGRDEEVVVTVIATPSAGQARALYGSLRTEVRKKTKKDAGPLPRYGDEQLSTIMYDRPTTNVWATELLVLRNSVVWSLQVGAHPSTSKPFAKAQAVAELRKYAQKQKLRAGAG